jgi:hypothetical protein
MASMDAVEDGHSLDIGLLGEVPSVEVMVLEVTVSSRRREAKTRRNDWRQRSRSLETLQ